MKTSLTGAMLALGLLLGCSPDLSSEAPRTAAALPVSSSAGIHPLMNAARSGNGLPGLSQSSRLAAIARGHAADMATNGFFSHVSSDGRTLGKRAREQNYRFCFIAENIAKGQKSVSEVMTVWMNSPGHRRNILSNQATEYGLAYVPVGNYWVMVLGRPGC